MAKKYIPQKLKLLVTIVNKGKGNFYIDQIETFGVNMQMLLDGEGTTPSDINNLWGFVNKEREVILSFVPEDSTKKIIKALENKFETVRNGAGIAFSIPISSIIGVAVYKFLVDNRKKGAKKWHIQQN